MCGWMMNSLLNINILQLFYLYPSVDEVDISEYELDFFSQRLFFKGHYSSFKLMDFRHAATQNSSELGKMFGQQDTFLAGVCEPKKKKKKSAGPTSLACHLNALSTRKLLFESVTLLFFRVMCTSLYVHVNPTLCFHRCCS